MRLIPHWQTLLRHQVYLGRGGWKKLEQFSSFPGRPLRWTGMLTFSDSPALPHSIDNKLILINILTSNTALKRCCGEYFILGKCLTFNGMLWTQPLSRRLLVCCQSPEAYGKGRNMKGMEGPKSGIRVPLSPGSSVCWVRQMCWWRFFPAWAPSHLL